MHFLQSDVSKPLNLGKTLPSARQQSAAAGHDSSDDMLSTARDEAADEGLEIASLLRRGRT